MYVEWFIKTQILRYVSACSVGRKTYCTHSNVQLSTLKWYWQWKPKISTAPLFLTTPWHVLLMFEAFLGLIGWHTNMAELCCRTLTLTSSVFCDRPTPINTHVPSPCDAGVGWDEIYCPNKKQTSPSFRVLWWQTNGMSLEETLSILIRQVPFGDQTWLQVGFQQVSTRISARGRGPRGLVASSTLLF